MTAELSREPVTDFERKVSPGFGAHGQQAGPVPAHPERGPPLLQRPRESPTLSAPSCPGSPGSASPSRQACLSSGTIYKGPLQCRASSPTLEAPPPSPVLTGLPGTGPWSRAPPERQAWSHARPLGVWGGGAPTCLGRRSGGHPRGHLPMNTGWQVMETCVLRGLGARGVRERRSRPGAWGGVGGPR